MKKLARLKEIFFKVWEVWYAKYVIVCVIGVLVVGFLDDNSVLSHIHNMDRIGELEKEINHYNELNQQNKQRIKELQTNPKAIEKVARERYFMKADDEDIFVLSDDEPDSDVTN
ncbi:MAG: septum formation initiator family protein [Prevotella sp.]|nr:septum formation initiator family protein [Prevotella sp.]